MEQLFYDPAGNRSKRITETTEEIYQYDKRNRLTTYTKDEKTTQLIYDPAGNLLKDSHAIYEYDAFHRNTKVETYNGNIQINRYDAEGLRHEIEENGTLVSFLFRGREVVVEETKEEQIRYIRTNELLASDAESARTYYHYASDEMGSITHVVEDTTIVNRYEYDAWGNATICEETVNNRFRFNGQQYDPVSQQYYLRARYYNPVIGRFTQEDTYRGDGLNLYAYCRNNPVYYVDPSGHEACPAFVKSIRKEIAKRTASKAEVKKLSRHLREKVRTGQKLNMTEKKAAKQLGIDYGKQKTGGSKSGSNTGLKEFDIVPYGKFKDYPGDGLTGHELLQNAWLDANGKIPKRGVGLSTKNPAIALRENPIHKFISGQQKSLGLNKKNLAGTSWRKNVLDNIQIMKDAGVPRDKIAELAWQTRKFAIDNGF